MEKYTQQEVSRCRTGELYISADQFSDLCALVLENMAIYKSVINPTTKEPILCFRLKVSRSGVQSPVDQKHVHEIMAIAFEGVLGSEGINLGVQDKGTDECW